MMHTSELVFFTSEPRPGGAQSDNLSAHNAWRPERTPRASRRHAPSASMRLWRGFRGAVSDVAVFAFAVVVGLLPLA